MESRNSFIKIFLLSTLLTLGMGCGGGGSVAPVPTPTPIGATGRERVEVVASATQTSIGDPITLAATYYDRNGQSITTLPLDWSVDIPERATVSRSGEFIGFAEGPVTISAKINGISGTKKVVVAGSTGGWSSTGAGIWGDTRGHLYSENVAMATSGDLYVAGTVTDEWEGEKLNTTATLTRYLPNGKRAWTRTMKSLQDSGGANGMALHPSGGAVVSATTPIYSTLAYYDAAGRVVWSRFVQGAGITDMASDRAGNIYAIGGVERRYINQLQRLFDVPLSTSPFGSDGNDGFIAKFGPDGAPLWCRLFTISTGVYDTRPTGVVLDETWGKIFVCGAAQPNIDPALVPFLQCVKLSDGASEWQRLVGPEGATTTISDRYYQGGANGSAKDLAHALTLDSAGNVWVGMSGEPGMQASVVKISLSGSELLRRSLSNIEGSNYRETAVFGLTFRGAQSEVVALVPTNSGSFLRRSGYNDATLIGMSLSGDERWRKRIQGSSLPGQPGNYPFLSLRALTSTAAGDLFAVGDAADALGPPDNAGSYRQKGVVFPVK
jgi:hypothetical protein